MRYAHAARTAVSRQPSAKSSRYANRLLKINLERENLKVRLTH
ncbi:hypothetical protein [Moorena sp. SIO3A2]|nr:hypothetical protein [Moorena sp. SIO3A2]